MRKHLTGWLLLSLLLIALDRITKSLALAFPAERALIPGLLQWKYVENTGMAFSLFSGQAWPLGLLSLLCVVLGLFLLSRFRLSPWSRCAGTLMVSGALSNAYDRLVYGYVVDMLRMPLLVAIFNVADALLVLGTLLMAYCLLCRTEDWRKVTHDAGNA